MPLGMKYIQRQVHTSYIYSVLQMGFVVLFLYWRSLNERFLTGYIHGTHVESTCSIWAAISRRRRQSECNIGQFEFSYGNRRHGSPLKTLDFGGYPYLNIHSGINKQRDACFTMVRYRSVVAQWSYDIGQWYTKKEKKTCLLIKYFRKLRMFDLYLFNHFKPCVQKIDEDVPHVWKIKCYNTLFTATDRPTYLDARELLFNLHNNIYFHEEFHFYYHSRLGGFVRK